MSPYVYFLWTSFEFVRGILLEDNASSSLYVLYPSIKKYLHLCSNPTIAHGKIRFIVQKNHLSVSVAFAIINGVLYKNNGKILQLPIMH